MKIKTSLALLGALSAMPSAWAIDPVTVYGDVNVSLESVKDHSNSFDNETDVRSNTSYVGVKGGADITDSLTAIYAVEWIVNVSDQSATNGSDNNITARNQYVGLAGNFGEMVIGRNDTILKQTQGKVDLFNNLRGDLATLFGGDNRTGDSVTYKTPAAGLLQAGVTWVTEGNSKNLDDDGETTNGASLGVWYGDAALKKSSYYAAVAYDSKVFGYDTLRVTAYGAIGPVQVGGMYQSQEAVTDGADSTDGYLLSAAWTIESIKLLAQYQTMDDKGDGWSVGGEYNLAKPTKAYAFFTTRDLDAYSDHENYVGIGLDHKF